MYMEEWLQENDASAMDAETAAPLTSEASPLEIARYAVTVLDGKKARNIRLLHTEQQTILADYFVICSGTSRTQIKSLADEVEYKLGLCGIRPLHLEGNGNSGWVLLDFGCVIVHVFSRDAREFYNLEKLYEQTSEENISELLHAD